MDLRSYLTALRKHLVIIMLAAVLGIAAAGALYARTPPQYASTVSFYISTPLPDGSNAQSAGQFAQSRVNSYILLLTSDELARRVILSSRVDLTPREVATRIAADSSVGTVFIKVRVTDGDPDRAVAIARGLTRAFPAMVDELDNEGRKTAVVVINTVSGPTVPTFPVAPNLRLMLAIGLAAGLLLGVLYAVARELLDTSIRTPESAQHVTKAPVLGVIPLDSGTRRTPLALTEPGASSRAEAYRKLRTNIRFLGATEAAKVVLVTSAVAGEGKTVTALNLALTLVEMGERVLFIDADLRRPRAAEYLDVSGQVGLTNVLAGEVAVDDALQPWGADGLTFLAAGSLPPNPSELLGSHQMRQLVANLQKRYDHIVLDTPPVLPVTDAVVASAHADIVVMVIRAGKTTRAQVHIAVDALRSGSATLAGPVLNAHRDVAGEKRYAAYYPSDRSEWTPVDPSSQVSPIREDAASSSVAGRSSEPPAKPQPPAKIAAPSKSKNRSAS